MQQLITQRPPFLHGGQTVSTVMEGMPLALASLLPLPVVHYGTHALWVATAPVASCSIFGIVACMIVKRQVDISELSSAVTGLVITMLMSQMTPLWLPVPAGAFAVLAARVPFGSTGNNPFNPAMAEIAPVTVFWLQRVFSFSEPSAALVPEKGLRPNQIPSEMLWDTDGGAIGTTAALVVIACVVYLIVKKTVSWRITVRSLVATGLIALLSPRIMITPLMSLKYELLSDSLLFCSVFLIIDPVTSPHIHVGKALYGAVAGVLIMLIRRYRAFGQAACFAVLLMNVISPVIGSFVIVVTARREARRNEQQ